MKVGAARNIVGPGTEVARRAGCAVPAKGNADFPGWRGLAFEGQVDQQAELAHRGRMIAERGNELVTLELGKLDRELFQVMTVKLAQL